MTDTRDANGTVETEAGSRTPGRTLSAGDRLYAVIGGAAMLLAVYFFLMYAFGGMADDTGAAAPSVPALVLESPQDGEVLDQPAAVVFRTTAKMEQDAMGLVSEGRHLHLSVGGTELMAGPRDITEISPGRYRWPIPKMEPGAYDVRVLWSGADHRPMREGASETINLRLR
jgi:hypothetical protein